MIKEATRDHLSPRPVRDMWHGNPMHLLRTFYRAMSRRRRLQLLLTFFVMLLGAAAELLTIGAVMPFLAVLTHSGQASRFGALSVIVTAGAGDPLTQAAIFMITAAVGAAVLRLLLLWISQRFIMSLGHDIATSVFGRMLRQPYQDFVKKNSSDALAGLEKVRDLLYRVLQPAMQSIIALVLATSIIALLIAIHPIATMAAASSIGALYVAVVLITRNKLVGNSRILAEAATARTKVVQEGLGSMRDIILDYSHRVFENRFQSVDGRFRKAMATNIIFASAPRYVVEAAGIIAITLFAWFVGREPGGFEATLPMLGALALGAQRLLPLLHQIYVGWSTSAGNLQALHDVALLLNAPVTSAPALNEVEALDFNQVTFDNVSFSYAGGAFALRDVNISIERGLKIGIIGTTGGGKSTLLDLLMGLLDPVQGQILVDGRPLAGSIRRKWQAQIAHVPQTIYLLDDSIAANIAFNVHPGEVDMPRVEEVSIIAGLQRFIDGLPQGYKTEVGERGIRLSGGERQRIGIARALYKRAPILILDEATSALDPQTEAQVIESIAAMSEQITLIMIAHRPSTLAGCQRLLKVEQGGVSSFDPSTGQVLID